ncbi:MAG: hypothetical protein JNL58_28215 [Planctomyces sp.]|nr:hypothetical protein [Planctomyces sp.]
MRFIILTFVLIKFMPESSYAQSLNWGSFKELSIELLPEDQRNIDSLTVKDGKATTKDVPIDFWGFTFKPDSLEVDEVFRYPIAEPPLMVGDRIIKVRSRAVDTSSTAIKILKSADSPIASAIVERTFPDGSVSQIRTRIHRANSIIFNRILKEELKPEPPRLKASGSWSWGYVDRLTITKIGTLDDGRDFYSVSAQELGKKPAQVILEGFQGERWEAIHAMDRDESQRQDDLLLLIGEDREVRLDGKKMSVGQLININGSSD